MTSCLQNNSMHWWKEIPCKNHICFASGNSSSHRFMSSREDHEPNDLEHENRHSIRIKTSFNLITAYFGHRSRIKELRWEVIIRVSLECLTIVYAI